MGLLLFADNRWIIVVSPAELRQRWTANSMAGCSAADSLEASITVSDVEISRRSREHGFTALRVWNTFDGHFMKVLAEREVRVWRRFHSLRHLLCDNTVAMKRRLRLFSSYVVSSMYWCAGSWILTRSPCTDFRALQMKLRNLFEKIA